MKLSELIDRRHPFRVPISTSSMMKGSRVSVFDGETLFVSEAMYELMRDPTCFHHVAQSLEVLYVPKLTPMLEMTCECLRR